ncbi:MAG: family 16 glycosylhydrolase [Bdellovibrionales bacterium]|nr:family 16 glycosylhydrolase [Bdellovibrionales bacterium]
MSHASVWFIFVLASAALIGCGQGFQGKIRPASEFNSSSGYCCVYGGGGGGPSAAPRANLVDNSGFEADFAGWEDWGSSTITTVGKNSGNKAVRITGTGGRGQEVIYRLQTGGTYVLKVFARVASTSDSAYVGVRYFDAGNATMGDQRVRINTTAFTEYSVRFQVPLSVSSAKIYVYKDSASATPVDADDFTLTMVEAPVNPPMRSAVANPNGYQPLSPGNGWTLVMNEEFTAASLNAGIWNVGYWFNYTINNELQAYRPENVQVGTGTMRLLAERRATTTTWGEGMNYASGAVTTRNKFTFTFGVVEARMKLPKGRGLHTAFWLLPNGKRSPPQIDILESLGHQPNVARFNYAYMDDNGVAHAQPMSAAQTDYSADFHTYTLQWLPDAMSYYIDGVLVGVYRGDFILRDPAYLILNLAVGGDEAGSPDGSTAFPQALDVDYIRIWQKPL